MRDWTKYSESSPLYTRMLEIVADDPRLMGVLNRIEHTPQPNLLLAAVQFLLLGEPDGSLSEFFPAMREGSSEPGDLSMTFTDYVLGHEEAIVEVGRTRYTQTNECRRCVALLPAVMRAPYDSFHLVDLGTSAGLNLALDRYHYSWDGLEWGPESRVSLTTKLRGQPPILREFSIVSRTGLDLNPIDPADPLERQWLEALVWPGHAHRRERLRAALDVVTALPVRFVAGDALVTLEKVLAELPSGEPAVVVNSFVMNQFSHAMRREVDLLVERSRSDRPVFRVSMETLSKTQKWPDLVIDDGSGPTRIGQAHFHGDWLDLYASP